LGFPKLLYQLITLALAEKISALMTEEYLGQRAGRGDRKKMELPETGAGVQRAGVLPRPQAGG